MSIRVQSKIWDTCLYSGGTLNVLLSMADWANDDGGDIFPGIDLLSARCRQSVRATQECIKRLRADRVVTLLGSDGKDLGPEENPKGGRGHRTEYRIDLERMQELHGLHEQEEPDCEWCAKRCRKRQERVQNRARKGADSVVKGADSRAYIDNHQDPSKNHQDSPGARASTPPELPLGIEAPQPGPKNGNGRVDLGAAYDAFNVSAARAGWPACQRRTPTRDAALRKRLHEAGGLDGWLAALAKAEASDFLCGRSPPAEGRTPFKASIDFLLQESSFTKLMEGNYDNRGSGPTKSGGFSAAVEGARRAAARSD